MCHRVLGAGILTSVCVYVCVVRLELVLPGSQLLAPWPEGVPQP